MSTFEATIALRVKVPLNEDIGSNEYVVDAEKFVAQAANTRDRVAIQSAKLAFQRTEEEYYGRRIAQATKAENELCAKLSEVLAAYGEVLSATVEQVEEST